MTDTRAAEAICRDCRRRAQAQAEDACAQCTYEVGALWAAIAEMDRHNLTPGQYVWRHLGNGGTR